MKKAGTDKLHICDTCPWLRKNQGRKHAAGWYTTANLRRLWTGMRTGAAPGMMCHSTDPNNAEYGGSGHVKPGKESECGGAVLLMCLNMSAFQEGRQQPIQPPMTRRGLAHFAWALIMRGSNVSVDDRTAEIGVPWQSRTRGMIYQSTNPSAIVWCNWCGHSGEAGEFGATGHEKDRHKNCRCPKCHSILLEIEP